MTGVGVGILGGAFDPPHVGHVELATRAIEHFGLERLLVRVVAHPGHKDARTPPEARLRLAELAFAELRACEVALDAFARTVDSLQELALDDPLFVVGADEFASFLDWQQPERVLELARLGVATRPGTPTERLETVLSQLEHPERVAFFPVEPLDVSSSAIRRAAARGAPLDGLVPAPVAAEIARLGLYARGG